MNIQHLYLLLSIIGYALGAFFYKIAGNNNMHPLMMVIVLTGVYVLCAPIIFLVAKDSIVTNLTWAGLLPTILGGVITGLGTLGYFFALKAGGAGQVTALVACYPALTLILSSLFLKEEITITKIFGCILALVSVFLLSLK